MADADAAKRAGRRLFRAYDDARLTVAMCGEEDVDAALATSTAARDAMLAAWDAMAEALGEVARLEPYGVAARALARAAALGGEATVAP